MKNRAALVILLAASLSATFSPAELFGQAGGDIEGALRRAVDQLNLDAERIGPCSTPTPQVREDMVRYGDWPAGLPPLIHKACFAAQAGACHQRAWISIVITHAESAEVAFAFLQKVTDHRRERLASGQLPYGPYWWGKIDYVDYQGCRGSRAVLVDRGYEDDPPKTEWLSWIQGPLLVEFVVNCREKEPDYGLEAAAYSLWKELHNEGFTCTGIK
jgi:hypothetical protein